MKYCPNCNDRYDEEIIKFCTKDGTPLIEEGEPSFTALPSENIEEPDSDFGEETIIRRKPVKAGDDAIPYDASGRSERIVIPTSPGQSGSEQNARPRTTQAYYQPPPPTPNTAKTVVLTILGTLVVLGFGAGLFWLLQKDAPANLNLNADSNLTNQNINLNTNLGFDSNFNFNTNSNLNTNLNTNLNANLKTPSPTPTPRPSPTPEPSTEPSPVQQPSQNPSPRPTFETRPPGNLSPTPTGTPRTGPRPPTPTNQPPGNGY